MQIEKMSNEEKRELEGIIQKNYGTKIKFREVLLKTKKGKIWMFYEDFPEVWWKKLRINSVGLYLGKLKRNYKIKLSLEGAQIVGKYAEKNIIEVDEDELKRFLSGENIEKFYPVNAERNNFVLVKHKDDIVGVGILRDGYVENLLPKIRRIILE